MIKWIRRGCRRSIVTILLSYILYFSTINTVLAGWSKKVVEEDLMLLSPTTEKTGLENETGTLVGMMDINGDTNVGLIYTDVSFKSLRFYTTIREDKSSTLKKYQLADVKIPKLKNPLSNLIVADCNDDKKGDILVMMNDTNKGATQISLFRNEGDGSFVEHEVEFVDSIAAQPMISYLKSSRKPLLVGRPINITDDNKISKWDLDSGEVSDISALFPNFSCAFEHPHSNVYIDFDNDCKPDLGFECNDASGQRSLQIWTGQINDIYTKSASINIPPNSGPLSYGDMNMDGTVDITFITCNTNSDCVVNIIYNIQKRYCGLNIVGTNCRKQQDMCTSNEDFSFSADTNSWKKIQLSANLLKGEYPLTKVSHTVGDIPIPVQLVDLNNDGIREIIIATNYGLVGFESDASLGFDERGALINNFVYKRITSPDQVISGISSVSFVDIDNNGFLDLLYVTKNHNGTFKTTILQNKYNTNGYYYIIYVHQGHCPETCSSFNVPSINNDSSINFGSVTKFFSYEISPSGAIHTDTISPKTSYFSLYPPYNHNGLIRNNNYIGFFTIGIGNSNDPNKPTFKTYELTLPNSIARISPYVGSSDFWKTEFYYNIPMSLYTYILIFCTTIMALSVIIIIILYHSKVKDKKERIDVMQAIDISET